jgi:hypothetical protein
MENLHVFDGSERPPIYLGEGRGENLSRPNKKARTGATPTPTPTLSVLPQQIRQPQSPSGSESLQSVPVPRSPFQPVSYGAELAREPSRAQGADPITIHAKTQQSLEFSIELAAYLLVRAADDRPVSPSDVAALIRGQTVVDQTLGMHPYGRANVKGDDPSGPRRYALAQYHLRNVVDELYESGAPEFAHLRDADPYHLAIGLDAATSRFMGAGRCESFTDVAVANLDGWMEPNEFARRAFHKEVDHAWLEIERPKPHSRATTPEPMIADPWGGPRAILASDGQFSADGAAVHLERRMDSETIARIAAIAHSAFKALERTTTVQATLQVTWEGGDPQDPDAPMALDDLIEEPQWDPPSVTDRAWVNEVLDRSKNTDDGRMKELAVHVAISMGVSQERAPRVAQAIIDAANRMR